MNMIPLVRATEPGKAQNVNPRCMPWNCSLEWHHQNRLLRKFFWKKTSKRVRTPFTWRVSLIRSGFLESRTLDVVR